MEEISAVGLKWIKRTRSREPIWVADEADVKAGYQPKTVNLRAYADQPEILIAKCNALQADMLLWRAGHRRDRLKFDGTIRSLLDVYESHPRSPFQSLKPSSRYPYLHYLKRLHGHIGPVRVTDVSGIDIMDWHDTWSESGRYLAAAATARAVLGAALTFGVMNRFAGCAELAQVLNATKKKLPQPRARTMSATADQVAAARSAAHKHGRPSAALAYAIVYETTLRLWDVIGQWWPIDEGGMSSVLDPGREMKWFGLQWEDIGPDMVLRYTPSKTAGRTDAAMSYPLAKAPMVLEELRHWPAESRRGPMIVSEETGLPYDVRVFERRWKVDRKAANLPVKLWARDLRASGITEGRALNASTDDAAKVAGHSSKKATEQVYDRAVLEAADRFAEARVRGRKQSGNSSGNER